MIEIRWAESDLSILETHPLTPGLILAGVTGTTTRTTSSASRYTTRTGASTTVTVSPDGSPNDGGLTYGAQIGIGVGVGLFAILMLGIAIFFIMRYRRKRNNAGKPPMQQPPPSQYPYPVQQYPYMPGPGQNGQPASGYPGYTTYVDPKTGAVTYHSAVPHPNQLGGTAIAGPNLSRSQGVPSTTGSQPTQAQGSATNPIGGVPSALPASHNTTAGERTPTRVPGREGAEGAATSTAGT